MLGLAMAQETPGRDIRFLSVFPSEAHGAELRTIVILDFDLVDDQHDLSPATVEYRRLGTIQDQLQDEFAKNGLYRIVDVGLWPR